MPIAAIAGPLPSGGQVTSGAATITTGGSTTSVNQTSQYAIINWNDFSIGKDGEVDFNNGTGATLNRVTGGQVSTIDGKLSATGSVYLINANGVVVGSSGIINVGGTFVASTQNISDTNFLNGGDLVFSGASSAAVINLGKISANGGDIALIASKVDNEGALAATKGSAGLAAGYNVILSDSASGEGKLQVQIGGSGTSVRDSGAIAASVAELRAQGGNIFALAGNTDALINAAGVSPAGGKIYLTAGTGGTVSVAGAKLTANTSTGDGGRIALTGQAIDVASDATLDASATGATGKGGSVSAIADMTSGSLTFAGKGLARGGRIEGDGGLIETSGASVDFKGASINTSATKGQTGTWLTDPYDLTVDAAAAATIAGNLGTTNVVLQTTTSGTSGNGTPSSGDGDINIDAPISWSSANTLTFDAYHSVAFNANVVVSGSGGVVIKTNDGGTGGDYSFASGSSLQFTGTEHQVNPTLTINGAVYSLAYNLNELGGTNVALATSLTDTTTHNNALVYGFSGTLEGLGNTVANLTINSTGWEPALIADSSGTIRDIGLLNVSITSDSIYSPTGALVASNTGIIKNAWVTGTVTSTASSGDIGGLVGSNSGTITNSRSSATVTAPFYGVGGLVGYNSGTVSGSQSSATVTGTGGNIGGLVGDNESIVMSSSASGDVSGPQNAGDLIGENGSSASVTLSSASGSVTGTGNYSGGIGGLVGDNSGAISGSFATGSVSLTSSGIIGGLAGSNENGASIGTSYATGTVSSNGYSPTGGLVGANGGTISDTFATGAVTSGGGLVGGLVGQNTVTAYPPPNYSPVTYSGSISNSYATGITTALYGFGGLVGANGTGSITNSYYDYTTTGQASGTQSDGSQGLSTLALQGALPSNFSNSIWSTASGLYPYLVALFPNGPQVVSGYATSSGNPMAGASIGLYSAGSLISGSSSTAGRNGYYYALLPSGTYGSGPTTVGVTVTASGATAVSGLSFGDDLTQNGTAVNLNVAGGAVSLTTNQTQWSVVSSELTSTFGANPLSGLGSANLTLKADAGFSIDGAISQSGRVTIQSDNGDLSIASGGSVSSGASGTAVILAANGSFVNTAGAAAVSAASGEWLIYSQANGNASALATGDVTGGLSGTNYYGDAFDFSSSSLASTPGAGNRFVHGAQPTLTVTAGTANTVYNGAAQTDTYTVTGYLASDQGADSLSGSVNGLTTVSKNVGSYTLAPSGTLASDENYAIAYASGTLSITPAPLTSSLTGTVTKTYDGTTSANVASGQVSLNGVISGDNVSVQSVAATYDDKNAGIGKTVTVSSGLLSGGDAGNYTFSGTSAAVGEIDKASLTLAAVTDTKTYDTTVISTGTPTTSGLAGGDTVTGLSQSFDSINAGSRTLSVDPTFTVNDGNGGGNYNVTLTTASGTINPSLLTALTYGIGNASFTYGQSPVTGTVTLMGLLAGDENSVSGVVGIYTGSTAVALNSRTSVGSYTEKLTGLTGSAASNYLLSSGGNLFGTLTITPAQVIASLTGSTSRAYDGTTVASLSGSNFGLSGVISGDSVSLVKPASGTYSSKDVGTNLGVTATGLGLSGSSAANYVLASSSVSGNIGSITPAQVIASLTGSTSRTYDGTTVASLTGSNFGLSGVISGDSVSLAKPATGTYSSKDVGTHLGVTATGLGLSGTSAEDYVLASSSISGNIGSITPAQVVASLTGSTSRTYDGTTVASLTGSNFGLSGVISGDSVSLVKPATGTYSSKDVGTNLGVTATGLGLSGTSAADYVLASSSVSGNIGSITPAQVVASLTGSTSKTYDGTTVASLTGSNFSLTGVVSGDSVTVTTSTSGTYSSKNAGSHIGVTATGIGLTGSSASDYLLASTSATSDIGTISPAQLVASLIGLVTKTYDGTTTAVLNSGNFLLSGVVAGDSVSLTEPSTGTYASKNAGTHIGVTATGLGLTGTAMSNYVLGSTSASGTVGTINAASLLVAANDLTKFTGMPDPALTYSVTGTLYSGDTLTGALTRDSGELPGDFAITQGTLAASSNYSLSFTPGVLVINGGAHQDDVVVIPTTYQPGASARSETFSGSGATGPQGDASCLEQTNCPYPDNRQISSNISFASH